MISSMDIVSAIIFLGIITSIVAAEAGFWVWVLIAKLKQATFKHPRPMWFVHAAFVIAVACGLYGYFIGPNQLEVTKVELSTDKLKSGSLRVVHFSDTHCEIKKRNEDKLVQIINDLRPDVVVFTGDTLNDARAIGNFKKMLTDIKAGAGKFAVKGNFENSAWAGLDLYSGTGFKLLDGAKADVVKDGQVVTIVGVNCYDQGAIENLLRELPADRLTILLDHYSDLAEVVSEKVDLYLAGHVHGGQIALPIYGAIVTLSKFGKKYEAGEYHIGKMTLYVNRGIGMEGGQAPQIRFFARPEITVIDLVPAGK